MIKLSIMGYGDAFAKLLVVRSVTLQGSYASSRYRRTEEYELYGAILFNSSLIALKSTTARLCSAESIDVDGRFAYIRRKYSSSEEEKFKTVLSRTSSGYAVVHEAVSISSQAKNIIFFSTQEEMMEGLYGFLMRRFSLPLLREWMPYIYSRAADDGLMAVDVSVIASDPSITLSHAGKVYTADSFKGSYVGIYQDWLEETVSEGLKTGRISITPDKQDQRELLLNDVDSYYAQFCDSIMRNLEQEVHPLMPLKGGVEEILPLGPKVPWKQQGAVINGAVNAFASAHKRSVILNCGMGTGKTLMGLCIAEGIAARKWLNANPKSSVQEMYAGENLKYRAIVMPPGHLVDKWAYEATENIPGIRAKVIEEFSDLNEIYLKGRKACGKELYVIGKDFAKLSCSKRPVPYRYGEKYPAMWKCVGCGGIYGLDQAEKLAECKCGRSKKLYWKLVPNTSRSKVKGLICEHCGFVLTRPSGEGLTASDFADENSINTKCPTCGERQWAPNVKTIGGGEVKKMHWHKVSHYINYTKKGRKTAWVLYGHENEYYSSNGVILDGLEESKDIRTRKWAPAQFIKSKLKGYFDLGIYDELHVFKGGGTAQGSAMHALTGSVRYNLGLTGTIAGGMASHFFYLMWRLAPQDMVRNGFSYESEMQFVEQYGTLESKFEANRSGRYNTCSKGRQISQTQVKPGISPVIFQDFLIDKTMFLDLSDMSAHLPELHEEVVTCELDGNVRYAYHQALTAMENAGGSLLSSLSSAMLQFSLSYPDKPYDYEEIIDPKNGANVVKPLDIPHEHILFPKEKALVDILNRELDEGRYCFVYAEYTGPSCQRIVERLKQVILENCRLSTEEVQVIESSSPAPSKREAWIHKRAAAGVKAFICNPKIVETGLDFIFEHEGTVYNYPVIVFYQMGMNLFTLWQASRRAYRLNQTEPCHTYYLCYDGTNQAKMIRLMAEKQIATSAIQGRFSMEGLAAMSQAVDPRFVLMHNLSIHDEDTDDAEEATRIFSSLNSATGMDESVYGPSVTRIYADVMGSMPQRNFLDEEDPVIDTAGNEATGNLGLLKWGEECEILSSEPEAKKTPKNSIFDDFFEEEEEIHGDGEEISGAALVTKTASKGRSKTIVGQTSIFDLFEE